MLQGLGAWTQWLTFKGKNAHSSGTVGLRQTRPPLPLHRRASSDLVLPPHGSILRPAVQRTIPTVVEDGVPDCNLLRLGGHMALLVPPCSTHSHALQENPQT